jgi:hypothetical protein
VVERDAFADLLLLDGNPLANVKLLEAPAKKLLVIMKGGKICAFSKHYPPEQATALGTDSRLKFTFQNEMLQG